MIALSLGFGLKAQCPYTQAIDFTATDVHGTEVHLFDILDAGQYVLIDFFFTTCGPCQSAVPKIVESYSAFGCNMHDVFYIEIANGDSDASCINWVNTYGVEYPTISGTGGGTSICSQYGIPAYPTVILIAPDHSIVIQDLWPINNAQTIITALENQGIEQHDCTPAVNPEVSITIDATDYTQITATFSPNEDCAMYYYMQTTDEEVANLMGSTGLELPEIIQQYGFDATEEMMQTFMDLTPETEYLICAVPADADGNLYEVVQEHATTVPSTVVETAPDFTATDINGYELNLYTILDRGQTVFIYFFMVDNYCAMAMPYLTEAYTAFGCNMHDVFFMEIDPLDNDNQCTTWTETYGVEFTTISRTGGGNHIVTDYMVGTFPGAMIIKPDHTIAIRDLYPIESAQTIIDALEGLGCEQHDCTTNVEEDELNAISLFPNPANDNVTLKGENLGTVSVFNALGQKVDEFNAENTELRINTTQYENGIYFVKADGQTLRFVVTH